MSKASFDPLAFYATYPRKVLARPGYPARAQFKSALLWQLFGARVLREAGHVGTYADVGGCFGFGANSLAYHVSQDQGERPTTVVFELAPEFISLGELLFPDIRFVQGGIESFNTASDAPFDLVTMLDVVEHLTEPGAFLQTLATRARFVLLKTPLETTGEWRGSRPPALQGKDHSDGHVNFFTPASYERLLRGSGFRILEKRILWTIIPRGAELALSPENEHLRKRRLSAQEMVLHPQSAIRKAGRLVLQCVPLPFGLVRKLTGGGNHLCLAQSEVLRSRANG